MSDEAHRDTHLSSFPSASGLGLLGLPPSRSSGRLGSRPLRDKDRPELLLSSEAPRPGPFLSIEPLRSILEPLPVMLILAIVSGLGDRRISSGRSLMGEEGADEVKGSDARFRASGRRKGAGSGVILVFGGRAGSK